MTIPLQAEIDIESLDHEGRGVAHDTTGKTVFIEGALPGERVHYAVDQERPRFAVGHAVTIVRASGQRVTPPCPLYGECGGCVMQHLEYSAQTAAKQRVLEDALWHLGRLRIPQIFAPIQGSQWGYRQRARIGMRQIVGKGMYIGFRRRHSSYLCDMMACPVLPQRLSSLLLPLHTLVAGLSTADQMPQLEFAAGEEGMVLGLRHLMPLTVEDKARLRHFAAEHQVMIGLQPGGPQTLRALEASQSLMLSYRLPEYNVTVRFLPTDFTQVNPQTNALLVHRAMQWLAPQPGERIADMFCGLGNFSLPMARLGAAVVGVEGHAGLVQRAADNAADNGLAPTCRFYTANLFEITPHGFASMGQFDKMLIDPPREGAAALVQALDMETAPRRIVYVSCNPATLARDAAILIHQKHYRLCAAGIANMFPHTAHVESIALFER